MYMKKKNLVFLQKVSLSNFIVLIRILFSPYQRKKKGFAVLSLLFLFFITGNLMSIETPKYTIIQEEDSIQIRDYTGYITAEVTVEGKFEEVGSKAFRLLFNYISGNNSNKQKLEMTAPVEQKQEGEKISMTAPVEQKGADGKYTLSFVLPQSYSIDTAPSPNDTRVSLQKNPPRRMACAIFSGLWTESNYKDNLSKLQTWIKSQNLKIIGEPIYARYNSPFSLWIFRRNEILIEVSP
jgi:effector-binding domain-containing protein